MYLWLLSINVATATVTNTVIAETEFAVNSDLENEFSALEELEASIKKNGVEDYSTLLLHQTDLSLLEVNAVNSVNGVESFTMNDMDWGSFAWGFLCCPIGFFVVGINKDKSQDQKSSFWIGVLIGSALNVIASAVSGAYSSSSSI